MKSTVIIITLKYILQTLKILPQMLQVLQSRRRVAQLHTDGINFANSSTIFCEYGVTAKPYSRLYSRNIVKTSTKPLPITRSGPPSIVHLYRSIHNQISRLYSQLTRLWPSGSQHSARGLVAYFKRLTFFSRTFRVSIYRTLLLREKI